MKSHHVLSLLAALALVSCRKQEGPPVVSGTIEVDEVHVASRYGGRVEKLFARDGDSLTNGQVIVELEAAELRAAFPAEDCVANFSMTSLLRLLLSSSQGSR